MLQVSSLDRANPNDLADLLRSIAIGSVMLGQITQNVRKANLAVADPSSLATLGILKLPDNAKASTIVRAWARAGGVALGELAPQAYGVTPTTTQISVTPSGDIACLLSDAYTSVDVLYTPERGDSNAVDKNGEPNANNGNVFPVVSNVITLPSALTTRGVILLTECEALSAGATGKKIILVPGSGAPAAGQARLNLAKTTITFAGADAVTRARVKLVLCPIQDIQNVLTATATQI